jgi:hypothetical protein
MKNKLREYTPGFKGIDTSKHNTFKTWLGIIAFIIVFVEVFCIAILLQPVS